MSERLNRIETVSQKVTAVKSYFNDKNIGVVIFDVDDTLVNTTKMMKQGKREICGMILRGADYQKAGDEKIQKVLDLYNTISRELKKSYHVWPGVYLLSVDVLVNCLKAYGKDKILDKNVKMAKERVERMYYEDSIELLEGAEEMLVTIKETGVRTMAGTHAEKLWSLVKLQKKWN